MATRRPRIKPAKRERVKQLTRDGYSIPEIARRLGIAERSVSRIRASADLKAPATAGRVRLGSIEKADEWFDANPPARTHVWMLYPQAEREAMEGWVEGGGEGPCPVSHAQAVKLALTVPAIRALWDFPYWMERYQSLKLWTIQREWAAFALQHLFSNIIGPPRFGKTQLFSIFMPSWIMCGGGHQRSYYFAPEAPLRNARIMLTAKAERQAKSRFLAVVKRLIHNVDILRDYGRFKSPELPWSESAGACIVEGAPIDVASGDFSLVVVGVGSASLGRGADWIFADDVSDLKNCRSVEVAEEHFVWLRTHIFSRRQPGGHIIVSGARLPLATDAYDMVAKMEHPVTSEPVFATMISKAVIDWDAKQVLDSGPADTIGMDPWDFVMEQYGLMLDQFEAVYQQNPQAGGWKLCHPVWIYGGRDPETGMEFPGCLDTNRTFGPRAVRHDPNGRPIPTVRVMSIDPSQKAYWAAHVMDIEQTGNEYAPILLDLHRARLGITDVVRLMEQWYDIYHFSVLIFEANIQASIMEFPDFQTFIRRTGVHVVWHKTATNKNDPTYGKQTLAGDVAAGRIRIPWGDLNTRLRYQILVNELLEEVVTDDTVMALWFPKWHLDGLLTFNNSGSTFPGFSHGSPTGPPSAAFAPPPRLEAPVA